MNIVYDGISFSQTFAGYYRHRYKKHGKTTQVLLHRYIWEKYNGKIPKGYVVHHIDEDPSNNTIENLKLMSIHDHLSYHSTGEKNPFYGKRHPEEILERIRKNNIGKKYNLGNKHTLEAKIKIGIASRNRITTDEARINLSRSHFKTVVQYDMNNNFIKEWHGIINIEKELGFLAKSITRVIKGRYKQAYGFIWKYKETVNV